MIDFNNRLFHSTCRIILFILFLISTTLLAQVDLSKLNAVSGAAIPINVSVSGKVKNPGSYYLTNMNRVTDAIYKASLITMTQNEPVKAQANLTDNKAKNNQEEQYVQVAESILLFDYDSSLRKVILRRKGKDTILDVFRFIRLGDTSQNPFLEDGDVIILLPIKMQVTIDGAVYQPGKYEISEKETLGDILELAQGIKPETDPDRVYLYRYQDDGRSITTLTIPKSDVLHLMPGSSIQLQDGDRIEFGTRADYHTDRSISVTGEVKYPGTYAIQDSISLLELLRRCGGPTDKADLRNAQAFNSIRKSAYDPAFSFLQLQKYVVTNKSDEDYLRMKIRQPVGLIATNVEKLWTTQDKTLDIFMHDNDIIHVPQVSRTVTLLGQVETPGVYDWSPSMTWSSYIDKAGGYNWNADKGKIRIIRAFSGNWIKPDKNTRLYTGDMIFIPSKSDRTNWDLFKETLLITSQIVTILFAVQSLTK